MVSRIQLDSGVFIDARNVPVALVGLVEGWQAGVLAALVGTAYRIWLGGSGAPAGVAGLVAAAVLGGLIHAWALRRGGLRARHVFTLAALVFLTSAGSFLIIGARGPELLGRSWLALLIIHAVGISVFGLLLHDVREHARLLTERERFRAIIDEASDAIRIVDPDTLTILDCNLKDCDLSGYSREEMIGRSVREFWPEEPELRAEREANITASRELGVIRRFGLPYRTRSGKIITIDSTRRVVEHEGQPYDIVIFRDAAEREAAEAAQRESADLRAIALVAGAAAHEINNPLTVVIGSLELLARHLPRGGAEAKWIDRAVGAGQRIREIVARMNRITRVERIKAHGGLPPMLDLEKSSDAN